jgi:hypothetical protein
MCVRHVTRTGALRTESRTEMENANVKEQLGEHGIDERINVK